jgi:Fe-S cluster assembly ATP-binding protein
MLELKNLIVSVADKIIIKNLNFTFKKNKVYVLMGPNGSGKSTLALALMAHPLYQVKSGKILFEKKDITNLAPEKRAQKGIFLSFQSPLSLSGVTLFSLLRTAVAGKKDPLALREKIQKSQAFASKKRIARTIF